MKKKFWVCKADPEDVVPTLNGGKTRIGLELLEKKNTPKQAEKYIKDMKGLYPSCSYMVLEVWEGVE